MAERVHEESARPSPNGHQKFYELIERFNLSGDPAARAERVAGLTTEDLIAMIAELHAVVAPESDINPSPEITGVRSPDGTEELDLSSPDERLDIFQQAVELIHQLSARMEAGDEQAFLERAANVIGLSIVLAHPYEDGNGRTARTLGHLIRNGYDDSKTTRQQLLLLAANRPSEGFSIDTYLPTAEGREMSPTELLQAAASPQISLKAKDLYEMSSRAEFTTPYS